MLPSDRFLTIGARAATLVAALAVLLILCFVIKESLPALSTVGPSRFFTDESWHPLSGSFNLLPMIVATLVSSIGALFIAFPLGLAAALFVQFFAREPLATIYRRLLELLAGIPSVVFGLWGLVVLAPLLGHISGGSGQSLLAATLVLALMILPTVTLLAHASIAAVPHDYLRGAAALGLQRHTIILQVVLPAARRSMGSAAILALTRALGETMAVLMVAGNVVAFPTSPFSPGRTLNANIALELGYASPEHRSILFVSGLILMLVASVLVIAFSRREGRPQ